MGLALSAHKTKGLDRATLSHYSRRMENRIKVGSIVYHRNPLAPEFQGPGTVLAIAYEPVSEVDLYLVLWQSSRAEWEHPVENLLTLAEKVALVEGDYD